MSSKNIRVRKFTSINNENPVKNISKYYETKASWIIRIVSLLRLLVSKQFVYLPIFILNIFQKII